MINFDKDIASAFATMVKSDFHKNPKATPGIVLHGYEIGHVPDMAEQNKPDLDVSGKILINYNKLRMYNEESKTIADLSDKIFNDVIKQI